MRKTKLIFYWILAIAPILLIAVLYRHLPEQVPIHWNLDGSVEYGHREQLWLFAGLSLFFGVLMRVVPKIDPRKSSYLRFQSYYDTFGILLLTFLLLMMGAVLLETFFPRTLSMGHFTCALLGILFMGIGNLMPKLKNNFFMGIKNPWTLSNEDVWNRTHRLGGILMFFAGVFILCASFWMEEKSLFVFLITTLILGTGIPTCMSYIWYRQISKPKS